MRSSKLKVSFSFDDLRFRASEFKVCGLMFDFWGLAVQGIDGLGTRELRLFVGGAGFSD